MEGEAEEKGSCGERALGVRNCGRLGHGRDVGLSPVQFDKLSLKNIFIIHKASRQKVVSLIFDYYPVLSDKRVFK